MTIAMRSDSSHQASHQAGFTLVEIAVVLVVIGVLLGGLLVPLTTQFETNQRREADTRLDEIHNALLGFAARNGRLPCPSTAASGGLALPNAATTACNVQHGFVPVRTLGLSMKVNGNGLAVDPWLNAYRYSVTGAAGGEFTNAISLGLVPDFQACEDSACASVLADNVVAVVFSTGEDGAAATSADQLENLDGDTVFVSRDASEAAGSEFDDRVLWISPNVLAYQLVRAGRAN